MTRIRSRIQKRGHRARIGAPDPARTPNGGLATITELCDRLERPDPTPVRAARIFTYERVAFPGG